MTHNFQSDAMDKFENPPLESERLDFDTEVTIEQLMTLVDKNERIIKKIMGVHQVKFQKNIALLREAIELQYKVYQKLSLISSQLESNDNEFKESHGTAKGRDCSKDVIDEKTREITDQISKKLLGAKYRLRHLKTTKNPADHNLAEHDTSKNNKKEMHIKSFCDRFSATNLQDTQELELKQIEIPSAPYPRNSAYYSVTSYESPSEFYIKLENEDKDLVDSLTMQLEEYYNKKKIFRTKADAKNSIGIYCVAYSDIYKNFYRARIIDWFEEDDANDSVKVQFVDYGDYLVTTFKALYTLSPIFARLPQMVLRCNLAFLFPIGSTEEKKLKQWSDNSFLHFKNIIDNRKNYYGIIWLENRRHSFGIDLLHPREATNKFSCIQEMLNGKVCVEIIENYDE